MKTKKILALALAAVLLVAVSVAGTLAWLADTTAPVVNTFEATGIDIELDEKEQNWTMEMIPGTEKAKNPIVSVEKKTDVDIILFVQFTEEGNFDDLVYTSTLTEDNEWEYDETNKVYYRLVSAADVAAGTQCGVADCDEVGILHWHLLDGDKVGVKEGAVKDADNEIKGASLTWQAWAIQQSGFVTDGEVDNVTNAFNLAKANGVVSTGD